MPNSHNRNQANSHDKELADHGQQAHHGRKKGWWRSKTPAAKAAFLSGIGLLLLCLLIFLLWANCRLFLPGDVADALLGINYQEHDELGNVIATHYFQSGWEAIGKQLVRSAFPLAMTFVIAAVAFLFYFLVKFIIKLSTAKSGRKGKTVGSLLRSCAKYATILIAIGVTLATWGVDVTAIVAGVGVLTLVVGLGCQSLINDIVSGLFLVFDDFFSVGDIVIVDGFRGSVVAIGLKTTLLLDGGGNYKSIANSSIKTVVNLSRKPSLFLVSIDASYKEDLERVEAVILENLPKINAANPKLTSPLTYGGISGFSAAGVTYLFLGYCKEEDRFQCTRDVTRDVYQMFVNNGIPAPLSQIMVNAADAKPRPKASKAEAKAVNAAWQQRRALDDHRAHPHKKRTLIDKTREVIIKEANKSEDE